AKPWHNLRKEIVAFRKEVIQPQLPLQLPCYDFVPVTSPALGGRLLAVAFPTSGVTSFHDVTGGVYKARERIHRSVADLRLLATPTSCRRVAACNPNYERLFRIGSPSRLRDPLCRPLLRVCSPGHKGHADFTSPPPSSRLSRAVELDTYN